MVYTVYSIHAPVLFPGHKQGQGIRITHVCERTQTQTKKHTHIQSIRGRLLEHKEHLKQPRTGFHKQGWQLLALKCVHERHASEQPCSC
jgi:hypothetical protein